VATTASPYLRHRFPPEIITQCVLLYIRFPLSLRAVDDMMLLRGVQVSYETIRRWRHKFGQQFAHELRRRRPRPGDKWHLDEVFLKINGADLLPLASGGPGGHRARRGGAEPAQRGGSEATDAQTDEEVALCPPRADHRQAPELGRGPSRVDARVWSSARASTSTTGQRTPTNRRGRENERCSASHHPDLRERFLSAFSMISPHFRPRRHLLGAAA